MLFTSVLVSILGKKKKKKLTSYNETNLTPSTSFRKTKRESLLLMQLKDKVMVPLQKKPLKNVLQTSKPKENKRNPVDTQQLEFSSITVPYFQCSQLGGAIDSCRD